MEKKRRTEIAELGEFGLIDLLTSGFEPDESLDAAGRGRRRGRHTASCGRPCSVRRTCWTEGVDFDLTYFPLQTSGLKAVTVAGRYSGDERPAFAVRWSRWACRPRCRSRRCRRLRRDRLPAGGIDLVGGDTKASVTGLVLSLTAAGMPQASGSCRAAEAQQNDLICISGNLGAGLHGAAAAGAREARVGGRGESRTRSSGDMKIPARKIPQTPSAQDIVDALAEGGIVPTSMIDLSDGLASDLLQILQGLEVRGRGFIWTGFRSPSRRMRWPSGEPARRSRGGGPERRGGS